MWLSTFLASIAAVKARPPARTTWLLCLFLLVAGLPVSAGAQTYSVTQGPSSDTLSITFPRKTPAPVVLRTGPNRVEALFPQGVKLRPAPASLGKGRFVAGVGVADNVLVVQTSGEGFGYIFSPKGANGYQIQFYADPQGAAWQPPAADGRNPAPGAAENPASQPAAAQTPRQAQTQPSQPQTVPQAQTSAPAQTAPQAQAPATPQTGSSEIRGAIGSNAPAVQTSQAQPQSPAPAAAAPAAPAQQAPVATPAAPVQSTTSAGSRGQGVAGQTGGQASQALPAAIPAPPSPAQYREAASAPAVSQPANLPLQAGPAVQAAPTQPPATGGAPFAPASAPAPQPAANTAPAVSPAGQTGQAGTPATPAPASPGSVLSGRIGGQATAPSQVQSPPPGSAPAQPAGQQSVQPLPAGQTPAQPQAQPSAPETAPAQPAPAAPNEIRGSISLGGQQPAPAQSAQGAGQAPPQAPGEAKPQDANAVKGGISGAISPQPGGQETAQGGEPKQTGQPGQPGDNPPSGGSAIDQAARQAITGPPPQEAHAPPAGEEQAKAEPDQGKEKKDGDSLEDSTFLISGEQALAKEDYEKALSIANTLLQKQEISKELREGALYLRGEAFFALNKDKLAENFEQTNNILQEALNYNTTSFRLPRMLIKLGYLNLRQGNLPEARAYFNLLARKYPLDEDVPLIDVYWGQYYQDQAQRQDAKGNLEKAAEAFKRVLSKYPESRFARDAALGLSQCLSDLGQYDESAKIIDYIDKRWPRYYIENPVLRRVAADVAYKLGEFGKANDDYLWYYNLVPKDSKNDLVLARLGDVSMKLGKRDAAREFYDMAIRLYPGQEGALMAMMRLAEQGIHDAPTLQEMFKAFKDPTDIRPEKIYEIIVNEFPKSTLAPLALLKLAMWNLYKEQYPDTLELVSRFTKSYPGDELEKQAVEVGVQAFAKIIRNLLNESDYKRILELWRQYPFLATRPDLLPDMDRLGVALALYYQGAPKEALTMVEPYLEKGPSPDTQKALALMLTIYRENQDWQAILNTLKKVSTWNLSAGPRRALEFAQAMALEYTGQTAQSRLLWARLAADPELSPDKRAYAVYYQARTAYDRQDYDKALVWAQDARVLFKEAAKDDGKARDALLLMIEANQAAGRWREALALCAEYETEAPEKSAEWAANRLRMAKLNRMLGDIDQWRKILTDMRDSLGDTLYGKLAASELNARGLEERAGKLAGPP